MVKSKLKFLLILLSIVLILLSITATQSKYIASISLPSTSLSISPYTAGGYNDVIHSAYRHITMTDKLYYGFSGCQIIQYTRGISVQSTVNLDSSTFYGGVMKIQTIANDADPILWLDFHTKFAAAGHANGVYYEHTAENGEKYVVNGINTDIARYLVFPYIIYPPSDTSTYADGLYNNVKLYVSTVDTPGLDEARSVVLPASFTKNTDGSFTSPKWVMAVIDLQKLVGAGKYIKYLRIDLGSGYDTRPAGVTMYITTMRFMTSYAGAMHIAQALDGYNKNYPNVRDPRDLDYSTYPAVTVLNYTKTRYN